MLRPTSTSEGLDADGLREIVAARDDALSVDSLEEIRVIPGHRSMVMVDDNPVPQPLKVIAEYLDAPAAFLASSDSGLAQHIINFQHRNAAKNKEVVFRDNKAIGVQIANQPIIKGLPIVETLLEEIGEVRTIKYYDLDSYVDLRLVGDRVTLKPKKDDITEGGLRCLYSELLARKPQVSPYVERLVCTNGMIIGESLQTFEFETMNSFLEQLVVSVQKSLQFVDTKIRAQLDRAAKTPVEKGEQALRQIFTSNGITPRLLPGAIAAFAVEEDGTAFGVLQAITRAANAALYSQRLVLQEASAKEMARLETVHCPTCWSTLSH